MAGAKDTKATLKFYDKSRSVFREGGSQTYAKSLMGGSQDTSLKDQKVLGVRWNVSTDQPVFSVQEVATSAEKEVPTKRRVMSIIGNLTGFLWGRTSHG